MFTRIQSIAGSPVSGALTACLLLTLGACGGDGPGGDRNNDGGDGTPSASAERQVEIAALRGFENISQAQEPPGEEEDQPASGDDMPARAAQTAEAEDMCANIGGEGYIEVDNNHTYTLGNKGFPDDFSNVPDSAPGIQQVADCEGDDILFRGQLDIASDDNPASSNDSGDQLLYYRAGGIVNDGTGDPDIDASFIQNTGPADFATRGMLYVCAGCVEGDLSDFNGDPRLNGRLAAFLVMEIGDQKYELGGSADELFVFNREPGNAGENSMAMTLDGRTAFQDNRDGFDECGYDVTYETRESLLIEDVTAGGENISSGELTLTVNDAGGQSFDVEYNDGNVFVDGERLEPEEISEFCPSDS